MATVAERRLSTAWWLAKALSEQDAAQAAYDECKCVPDGTDRCEHYVALRGAEASVLAARSARSRLITKDEPV